MTLPFRRALTLILATSLAVSGLTAIQLLANSDDSASAVDAHDFDPGEIISDAVFYNTSTMTASSIQSFLNSKVRTCRDGYTCLKDYKQTTRTIPADPMCKKYVGASSERASTIIYKVSQACGINPQALVVLLQKEQGLVTDDWPSAGQYETATGYACPDTAPCNAEYFGFFNQVYKGAWALKRYTMPPGTGPGTEWYSDYSYQYWPGETSRVLYNPSSSCGSSSVFIKNKATTSLYWYTPYQPNNAALDAGYGLGNGCSAYGNRNFFLYFSDWFGSVRYNVGSQFATYYASIGGVNSPLGGATGPARTLSSGGSVQSFANGALYQKSGLGVHAILEPFLTTWGETGWENGALGYAISDIIQTSAGPWQKFEHGGIYQNSRGATYPVRGAIYSYYDSIDGITSEFGAPRGAERSLASGGAVQNFENGNVYWKSGIGAHPMSEPIQTTWKESGWESGPFGYPSSDVQENAAGMWQEFEDGLIYLTSNGQVLRVKDPTYSAYASVGGVVGAFGAPIRDVRALSSGGTVQNFRSGNIYWKDGLGAHPISGAIQSAWKDTGWEAGPFGYPVSDVHQDATGTWQLFEHGVIHVSTTGQVRSVLEPIFSSYSASGGVLGPLGLPSSAAQSLADGGSAQTFAKGEIYWKEGLGAHSISGAILTSWKNGGGAGGTLGYPVSDLHKDKTGSWQEFEGGIVFQSATGDVSQVHGETYDYYDSIGGVNGSFGAPLGSARTLSTGGTVQNFERGNIYWKKGIGAHPITEPIQSAWKSIGWEAGRLGYPIGEPAALAGGGVSQQFEAGSIFAAQGHSAILDGDSAAEYVAHGGPTGEFGWPVNARHCGLKDNGCVQTFQGAYLYETSATGAHFIPSAIGAVWKVPAWENGPLGYPTGGALTIAANGGGASQEFQGGRVYAPNGKTGRVALNGPVLTKYIASAGPGGVLAWPTSAGRCGLTRSGCVQSFQKGYLYWTTATGAHIVDVRIGKLWAQYGWEQSKFGYPTSDPKPYQDGVSQTFEHGTIAWTPTAGARVLAP
ncbi:LGFP repeat-containing protein [Cryobacterium tepidiphilum]|uniref:LGFP repeat-containing protein n=1 Tax=Cryobacterium tepidiphilum TaxID=2486026 RepID=A0A3M8L153_9MICO|nr:hypothetical protein [Cryobacterium tepidiphilum]RNE59086.1 hypothetical protein EEJ31_11250 [Cryobacterium tepidiphilum]